MISLLFSTSVRKGSVSHSAQSVLPEDCRILMESLVLFAKALDGLLLFSTSVRKGSVSHSAQSVLLGTVVH
ncbi:hypothetical protein BU16DRAFT_88353 [Lophium mytilinum]|uniref:Uncharacterized protein n=1 Tax=Lophium mytilinum TaxID=390894 RepID=A0A6A6QJZ6_9PEZI|nr:hypothetical protein BU16DRAFT_88353 [Lophium mytilinum]